MNKLISGILAGQFMSLDKFISGKRPAKKKKAQKSSLKEQSSTTHIKKAKEKPSEKKSIDQAVPEKTANITDSKATIISPPVSTNTTDISEAEDFIDNRIFTPELQNKDAYEMFMVILDIIHNSPSYATNKNLIAQYYMDHKDDFSIEYLSEQLSLSYNEIYVLLAEIKQDFD